MQVNICGDSVYGFSLFLVLCLWLFALFCAETLSLLLALICSVLNGVLTLHSWVGCAPGTGMACCVAAAFRALSICWKLGFTLTNIWKTIHKAIKLTHVTMKEHDLMSRKLSWNLKWHSHENACDVLVNILQWRLLLSKGGRLAVCS